MNFNIILIEDNPDDVELVKRAVNKHPLNPELTPFKDGPEALDYLFSNRFNRKTVKEEMPDFVLLDLMLPKMNGFSILEALRTSDIFRYIPVVIFTSSNEISDINKGYLLGANSFVQKPIDYKEYNLRIFEIINYWLSSNINPYYPVTANTQSI